MVWGLVQGTGLTGNQVDVGNHNNEKIMRSLVSVTQVSSPLVIKVSTLSNLIYITRKVSDT